MSTRARSPEVDELSCVPETRQSQQAAGVEELVVGVVDPVEMSDTEQGDIGLETQQDTSDEDTQAATGTQSGKGKGMGKADKRNKKPPLLFTTEQEQKIVDFLHNNEILYDKRLMDYKDRSKREAMWDKFCDENNLNKNACQKWFQSPAHTLQKVTHMKSGQGEPVLTERQKWTRDNFDFLRDHIVYHLTTKIEFRAPKGSASQTNAAAGSSSRRETVHSEPFQDTSHPESTWDPSDISHLETHTPTTPLRAVSVTSSLADSNLKAALAESQRGITELKDIVVKKFGDKKPDDPRLGFCDFLKVVQLTSNSYDEFQQETVNLLMRLKCRDK